MIKVNIKIAYNVSTGIAPDIHRPQVAFSCFCATQGTGGRPLLTIFLPRQCQNQPTCARYIIFQHWHQGAFISTYVAWEARLVSKVFVHEREKVVCGSESMSSWDMCGWYNVSSETSPNLSFRMEGIRKHHLFSNLSVQGRFLKSLTLIWRNRHTLTFPTDKVAVRSVTAWIMSCVYFQVPIWLKYLGGIFDHTGHCLEYYTSPRFLKSWKM